MPIVMALGDRAFGRCLNRAYRLSQMGLVLLGKTVHRAPSPNHRMRVRQDVAVRPARGSSEPDHAGTWAWTSSPRTVKNKLLLFILFLLFRATPTSYGSSQATGWIRATAAGLHYNHSHAASATYTTAHGKAGSLTHWARPRIKPASSWRVDSFPLYHSRKFQTSIVYKLPSLWYIVTTAQTI